MPPTRRLISQRPLAKRRITRRRSRNTTWIELIADHNATTSRKQGPIARSRASSPSAANAYFTSTQRSHQGGRGHNPPTRDQNRNASIPPTPLASMEPLDEGTNPVDENSDADETEPSYDDDCDPLEEGTLPLYNNSDADENEAAAKEFENILNREQYMVSPANLIALTLLCGTVKFSVKQYEIVRVLLKFRTEALELPSYTIMQRKYFPHLIRKCFPGSEIVTFPKTGNAHVRSVEGGRLQHKDPSTRIVFPTEWARLDIATLSYFEKIFGKSSQSEGENAAASIEDSAVVRNRDAIVNPSHYLFVEDGSGKTPAAAGDNIMFNIGSIPTATSLEVLRRQHFHISRSPQGFRVAAEIIATWCVGSPTAESESSKLAASNAPEHLHPVIHDMAKGSSIRQNTSAEDHRSHRRSLKRFFTEQQQLYGTVAPGDFCTLLSSVSSYESSQHDPTTCCVFISRCFRKYEGTASQFVVWIRLPTNSGEQTPYSVLGTQSVIGLPKLVSRREKTGNICTGHLGRLKDGRRFATYRMLLYCDDFKSSGSLYSQASCGGIYMLPVGLSQKARRSRKSVHVISLTPPGVSTNEIILKIIPDLVRGSKGVEGVLPSGEPVLIFLDVVGFVADYPAAAEPLDVLGHTADTPCTHCTIRKSKHSASSMLGFTTNVHASFSPSIRCAERHEALRGSGLSDRDLNILGMKPQAIASMKEYPLMKLREELLAARPSIPLTSEDVPVVTGLFDPFRLSLIAPDHLLSGLARNVIDLCFRTLRPGERKDLDIAICSALHENGLPRQSSVFNEKKIQLHSMSLSSVFSVLLVLHPVCVGFDLLGSGITRKTLHLATQLKDVVAMTYWHPSVATDGREAYDLMRMEDGRPYHSFLQGLAERYVTCVDAFCASHSELSTILDKPNLHRLLELYHHSIPAFGHVSLFQELVFETAHQPLKRSLARGNHRNAEASAVEHCLGNDWQARIGMLYSRLSSRDEQEREAAFNGLQQLIIGRDAMRSGINRRDNCKGLNIAIERCFHSPLLHAIRSNGTVNNALAGGSMQWVADDARGPPPDSVNETMAAHLIEIMRSARGELLVQCGMFGKTLKDFKMKWKAKRKIAGSAIRQSQVSITEVLTPGTLLQAFTLRGEERPKVLRPQTDGDGTLAIFMVLGILDGGEDNVWTTVVRCQRKTKDKIRIPSRIEREDVQLLHLNEGPRRVAVYHICKYGDTCNIDHETKSVRHGESPLSGGSFFIQTRSQGYPPRIA